MRHLRERAAARGYEVTREYALNESAWTGDKVAGEYRPNLQLAKYEARRVESSTLIVTPSRAFSVTPTVPVPPRIHFGGPCVAK